MRSAAEIAQYDSSYKQFVTEVNEGAERYFDCDENQKILRQAMLTLMAEQQILWEQAYDVRIWGALFAQNIAKLKTRPTPVSRRVKERILEFKDRKDSGYGSHPHFTEIEQMELERQSRAEAKNAIESALDAAIERTKDAAKRKVEAEDIALHPLRYIPAELAAFDRDATEAEMRAMPSPVLKCWMARRQAFVRDEALKAQRENESLRVMRELGGAK